MSLLLRAKDVELAYSLADPVVMGVSMEVRAGELVSLIGPNGAGKSSLLRSFVGAVPHRKGELEIGDDALEKLSARERARRVALLPQEAPLHSEMTVTDFVAGGRYAHRGFLGADLEGAAALDAALRRVSVFTLAARPLAELSGGQRQRVLLARALAQGSPALLVDEPTSSLDARHQISTFSLLRDLVKEGRGVLAVTHDLNLASQFSDRIYLLAEGRLLAEGEPHEVLRRDILEPVYGENLVMGSCWSAAASAERPFVLAWDERKLDE
jgi:ABC-type cobalamin/Fe3+-siderophores transport system ATPase subunit